MHLHLLNPMYAAWQSASFRIVDDVNVGSNCPISWIELWQSASCRIVDDVNVGSNCPISWIKLEYKWQFASSSKEKTQFISNIRAHPY